MIPLQLSISGFLSYRDEVDIDFTGFDLACISGANGSGKSSILDAITFALFGQARKRDDSLINTRSEMAEIVYTFNYEGNVYKVQRAKVRGKSSLLEFHVQGKGGKWKSLTERRMRETDELIQKTLRLDYETFVNASFFLQGKADQFTQQRPADRKRILSSILGLETWETYRNTTAEKRRSLDTQIAALEGRIQEINSELSEEAERQSKLKDLSAELERLKTLRYTHESNLKELRGRSSAVQQQADLVANLLAQKERRHLDSTNFAEKLASRQAENDDFAQLIERKEDIQAQFQQRQELESQSASLEKLATSFHSEEIKRATPLAKIEASKAKIETEISNLATQESLILSQQERSSALEAIIMAAQQKAEDAQKSLDRKAALALELDRARSAQAKVDAENPHLKEQMDVLVARIDQIKQAKGAACPTCGQPLTEEHRSKMVTLWSKDGKQKGDQFRANNASLKKANSELTRLEKEFLSFASAEKDYLSTNQTLDQLKLEETDLSTKLSEWQKQGQQLLLSLRDQLTKEAYAVEERAELASIDKELKEIGYDAAEHDQIRRALNEDQQIEIDFRKLENAEAALKPLKREISEIKKQIEQADKESDDLEKSHTESLAALNTAQADLPHIENLELQNRELLDSENQLQQEVGAANQRVAVLETVRTRKAQLESEREEIALRVSRYQSLESAFGKDGVPAMLIEQALPQIETKANEILERLSGGQMHISFITQQAYKDKKREDLRETLEIQISDSAGIRDYEMFSGGEAFRINFAVRLALSEVLAQRAGAKLQTLVIDEGFGSQDEIGRQRLIEAINMVKKDFAKILIITHIDSLKDAFPTRIEVEKSDKGSFVTIN